DPHVVIVAVRRPHRRPIGAAIGRLIETLSTAVDDVLIRWIRLERHVIERTRDELAVARDQLPRLTSIFRAIETATWLRFDERVQAIRIRGGDGDVRLADELGRKTRRHAREVLAAVRALVEPDARGRVRAANDRPRLALTAPHPRVNDVRIRGIELEIGGADA